MPSEAQILLPILLIAADICAAVATLGKMMVEPTAPPSNGVRAAEVIINQAAKAIELEDIEARLTELERAAGAQNRGA
jgi:hypothetical protein